MVGIWLVFGQTSGYPPGECSGYKISLITVLWHNGNKYVRLFRCDTTVCGERCLWCIASENSVSCRKYAFLLEFMSFLGGFVFFQAFVEAQNKLTVPFLEQCPVRGLFKERMTELYDYPKYSCHFKKGKRYVKNVFVGGDEYEPSQ